MKLLDSLRFRIAALFHRSQMDTEMEDELRPHIQHRADDLQRSGVPRTEAERRARIEFGGYQKFKEECREGSGNSARSAGIGWRCPGDGVAGAAGYVDSGTTRALNRSIDTATRRVNSLH
jgi:hypothetical protein